MKLSIIIVNYNTGALTRACVESVLAQKLPFKYEIVVVDNDSSDLSVSFLRSDFPDIKVIQNKKNLGLAGGVNKGLAETTGKYRLILNPDIVVMPRAIEKMVELMDKDNKIGMLGGELVSPNGKKQYSCYRFYRPITILYRRTFLGKTRQGKKEIARFLMKDYDRESVRCVDWLMGACLMVREKAIDDVGGMDERFFLYFEDVDWCRRFWKGGWRVCYMPTALFSHYHQKSSEKNGLLGMVSNRIVREHISSAIKYFWKYRK
jgi:hypothetical protein